MKRKRTTKAILLRIVMKRLIRGACPRSKSMRLKGGHAYIYSHRHPRLKHRHRRADRRTVNRPDGRSINNCRDHHALTRVIPLIHRRSE